MSLFRKATLDPTPTIEDYREAFINASSTVLYRRARFQREYEKATRDSQRYELTKALPEDLAKLYGYVDRILDGYNTLILVEGSAAE